MKKHMYVLLVCFGIIYTFLLNCDNSSCDICCDIYKEKQVYHGYSIILNEIQDSEEIELVEENEVNEKEINNIVVENVIREDRPTYIKHKIIIIKPKFRKQSARRIVGDEEFAKV